MGKQLDSSRNNNINLLRFVAASMVVSAHMYVLLGFESPLIMGDTLGGIAVRIFFLISGFLIACSWKHDPDVLRFLIRRVFRIVPGLATVVLLTTFVLGPLVTSLPIQDYFAGEQIAPYLGNIIFLTYHWLPGVFETNPYPGAVNSSLWTLQYEFFMYLMIPVTFFLSSKLIKNRIIFPAIALFCLVVSTTGTFINIPDWPKTAATLGAYFFTGSTFFVYDLAKKIDVQWAVVSLGLMILLANHGGTLGSLMSFALITVFTFSFSYCENPIFGHVFDKNDYSYGLYIYAFPISQTIVYLIGPSCFGEPVYFLIAEVISVGFAMLSWHLVEKPAMAAGKALVARLKASNN